MLKNSNYCRRAPRESARQQIRAAFWRRGSAEAAGSEREGVEPGKLGAGEGRRQAAAPRAARRAGGGVASPRPGGPGTLSARNLGAGAGARRTGSAMEQTCWPRAEADAPGEEEAGAAMAAVAAAGGTGPAVLQVAGLYRGLCAVRTRALGLGLVSPAQLRVFPVRRGSGGPAGGADGSGVGAELEANPFYDRYRDKIQQLRRCGPRPAGRRRAGRGGVFLVDPTPSVLRTALRSRLGYCLHSVGDVSVCGLREAG